nr:MAG TPA: hypothetical protein [Caudoviricetes sp.]
MFTPWPHAVIRRHAAGIIRFLIKVFMVSSPVLG